MRELGLRRLVSKEEGLTDGVGEMCGTRSCKGALLFIFLCQLDKAAKEIETNKPFR